jgi:hypothetical protein
MKKFPELEKLLSRAKKKQQQTPDQQKQIAWMLNASLGGTVVKRKMH